MIREVIIFVCLVFFYSVNSENSHVELSTLPKDTGVADILPESLHLPLRKRLEKKRKRKISESAAVVVAVGFVCVCVCVLVCVV